MNNFEKIKQNLTVEKLARLINLQNEDICLMCSFNNDCNESCIRGIKQWLLQEVDND